MEIKSIEAEYTKDNNFQYSCQYHVVFTPKYRRKVLTGEILERLLEIFDRVSEQYNFKIVRKRNTTRQCAFSNRL